MSSSSKALWSKTTRIKVMIIIDTTFFLVELISGLLSHSLALTADAFHMLNDIISLVIGLWAVIASQKATTDEFTFGWVRAEILGAFFNAVFLIALCVSIILEAFTRFFEPPEIDNPKLILIVGATGLASNLLGFLVLGGHGHSHGHGHDHEHEHEHDHVHDDSSHGFIHGRDVEEAIISASSSRDHLSEAHEARVATRRPDSDSSTRCGDEPVGRDESSPKPSRGPTLPQSQSHPHSHSRGRNHHRRSSKAGRPRFASIEDMSIHPASIRQDILAASLAASSPNGGGGGGNNYSSMDASPAPDGSESDERSPLLKAGCPRQASGRSRRDSSVHDGHNHNLPRKAGSKVSGHSHADMGMNAMALHVVGDALGNIGVIVSALIIWLTDWPGKLYADPAVSLFITLIILKTSIPLTLATSRVLLQGTPENVSIQDIREDIERLPGVVSCHHIHVWQLSDTKIVASMHLQVSFPINTHSGEKYMQLAKRARKCLHAYGIHSVTIQPEFCLDRESQQQPPPGDVEGDMAALALDGGLDLTGNVCLLECVENCEGQGCCTIPEVSSGSTTRRASESSHGGNNTHRL